MKQQRTLRSPPVAGRRLGRLALPWALALAGCQQAAPPVTIPSEVAEPAAVATQPSSTAATPEVTPTGDVAAGPTEALAAPPSELAEGQAVFDQHCATCHGPAASGSDQGPPLVHKIYEPSHHGNGAFVRAVVSGVTAHHWDFGDMQPVEGVSAEQVKAVTLYVRWLQEQQGIR